MIFFPIHDWLNSLQSCCEFTIALAVSYAEDGNLSPSIFWLLIISILSSIMFFKLQREHINVLSRAGQPSFISSTLTTTSLNINHCVLLREASMIEAQCSMHLVVLYRQFVCNISSAIVISSPSRDFHSCMYLVEFTVPVMEDLLNCTSDSNREHLVTLSVVISLLHKQAHNS